MKDAEILKTIAAAMAHMTPQQKAELAAYSEGMAFMARLQEQHKS